MPDPTAATIVSEALALRTSHPHAPAADVLNGLCPVVPGVVLRNTAVVIVLALACGAAARAQVIYTCIDAQGRQRASDGPIAECSDREQRVLNKDGSVRRIIAPITAYEAAEREALERKSAEERSRYDDAVRRDRNLKKALPPCPRGPSSDWPPAWPAACPTATQYQG